MSPLSLLPLMPGSSAILSRQTGQEAVGLPAGNFLPQIEHLRTAGEGAGADVSASVLFLFCLAKLIPPNGPLPRRVRRTADEFPLQLCKL
jgi:hypothetical protein